MGIVKHELSDNVKLALWCIGYTGACVGICYVMYKWLAALVGKEIVKQLIKAGVITVL